MTVPKVPAVPSTPAQIDRYARVLWSAAHLVDVRGGEAVDVADIADHAKVALATLYRYFPSRTHLFACVGVDRMRRARARVSRDTVIGETAGECVRSVVLEQFRLYQEHPELSRAILEASNSTDPLVAPLSKQMEELHLDLIIAGARVPGPMPSVDQLRLIPIVYYTLGAVGLRWLGGQLTSDDAVDQLGIAALTLDRVAPAPV